MPDDPDALHFLEHLVEEADSKLREIESYALHCSEHLNWTQLSGEHRAFIAASKEGARHALQSLRNSNAYV